MTEENKTLDGIMGNKPELELGREYKIDLYPFGKALIEEGRAIEARYRGYVDKGPYLNKHVFVSENENGEKIYHFFSEHWTCEIRGIITYPCVSSASTESYSESYFKEELPKRLEKDTTYKDTWERKSKLLEILRELGEQI